MRLSTDLDSIDVKILEILQRNGRIQLGALAELVGLSAPAVGERLRKLEERCVILGFAAQLAPAPLALDISAYIMVRVDSSTHYSRFLEHVSARDEVMECHAITGDASHLLKIRTRNTATLESLLAEIQRWPGVIGTRTSLVLSTHKESLRVPTEHLQSVINEERATAERRANPSRRANRHGAESGGEPAEEGAEQK